MSAAITGTINGRVVRAPEIRTGRNGTSYLSFTVAADRSHREGDEDRTAFIRCVAFSPALLELAPDLTKGAPILARGSLREAVWNDAHGEPRYALEAVLTELVTLGAARHAEPPLRAPLPEDVDLEPNLDDTPW